MISTYKVAEYSEGDTSVEVTYENSDGFIHNRTINIPHFEDGSINTEYFNEILEGQLRGVNNKLMVGAITFINPNQEVGIAST